MSQASASSQPPPSAKPLIAAIVGFGDERFLAGAGEDHCADVVVRGGVAQSIAQLGQRGDVQRVERVLPVDGDDGDRARAVDADQVTGTFPLRKSTISL